VTGPRSCVVCGPGRIEGCWRCGATFGHRHLDVVARDGSTVGRVAVCGAHGPPRLPDTGGGASVPPVGRPAIASGRRKLWRDRTRRRAIRRLTDLHRDEYLQLLAEERGA